MIIKEPITPINILNRKSTLLQNAVRSEISENMEAFKYVKESLDNASECISPVERSGM